MSKFKIIDSGVCSLCKKHKECVVITKKIGFWFFKYEIKINICDSCISRIFRSFRSDI